MRMNLSSEKSELGNKTNRWKKVYGSAPAKSDSSGGGRLSLQLPSPLRTTRVVEADCRFHFPFPQHSVQLEWRRQTVDSASTSLTTPYNSSGRGRLSLLIRFPRCSVRIEWRRQTVASTSASLATLYDSSALNVFTNVYGRAGGKANVKSVAYHPTRQSLDALNVF